MGKVDVGGDTLSGGVEVEYRLTGEGLGEDRGVGQRWKEWEKGGSEVR